MTSKDNLALNTPRDLKQLTDRHVSRSSSLTAAAICVTKFGGNSNCSIQSSQPHTGRPHSADPDPDFP